MTSNIRTASRLVSCAASFALLACAAGCSVATSTDGEPETTSAPVVATVKLRLKTTVTQNYLMAENGGGSGVDATSTNASTWETFTAFDLTHAALTSGDQIELAALSGQFIAAENGGGSVLNANRAVASTWETFVIAKTSGSGAIQNGDVVTLRTVVGKDFVSADNGGGGIVTADRTVAQAWENFTVEIVGAAAPTPPAQDAGTTPPPPATDSGTTPPPPPPPPSGTTDYAPYFYTWSWNVGGSDDFASLMNLHNRAGLNGVTLAFVLSNGGCATDQGVQSNLSDVKAFIAAGGKVKASFGGASGAYIENKCNDAASLTKAIEDFVDQTGIKDLDFDVEQDPAFTATVNERRATALKQVQVDRGIKMSFTLAANASYNGSGGGGLTSQGIGLLKAVLAHGATISHVNLMTMDYGDDWASKDTGQVAINSITDANAQLRSIIPGLSTAAAWGMIGVTPMIGRNDDSEVFSVANAQEVASFVRANKVGLVAFWAINRDTACSDYNNCATTNSAKYAFHNVLKTVQ